MLPPTRRNEYIDFGDGTLGVINESLPLKDRRNEVKASDVVEIAIVYTTPLPEKSQTANQTEKIRLEKGRFNGAESRGGQDATSVQLYDYGNFLAVFPYADGVSRSIAVREGDYVPSALAAQKAIEIGQIFGQAATMLDTSRTDPLPTTCFFGIFLIWSARSNCKHL